MTLERQAERRATCVVSIYPDKPTMRDHHLPRQSESNAGPSLFGGEKGNEYLACHFARNSGAIIVHFYNNVAASIQTTAKPDNGFIHEFRSLPRIAQQVQQYGFQKVGISVDVKLCRGNCTQELDIIVRTLRSRETANYLEQSRQTNTLFLGRRKS